MNKSFLFPGCDLLNLYGDDDSHDDEIFTCIKECQLYLGSAINIALRGCSLPSDTGDRIQVVAGDFCEAVVNFNSSVESKGRLLTDVALGE